MIYNNIDGTQGSTNQLLDLLQVVANPSVYEEKIKALQAAIEENKQYVELIAPASDIRALRDRTVAELETAKAETKKAKEKANEIVRNAETKAAESLKAAKSDAKDIIASAEEVKKQAAETLNESNLLQSAAEKVRDELDKEAARIAVNANKIDAELEAAKKAKKEYEAKYKEIIQKHADFIRGL